MAKKKKKRIRIKEALKKILLQEKRINNRIYLYFRCNLIQLGFSVTRDEMQNKTKDI